MTLFSFLVQTFKISLEKLTVCTLSPLDISRQQ